MYLCQDHIILITVALKYIFKVRKFGVSGSILLSQDFLGYVCVCVCVVPYKLSKFVFLIYNKYCQDFDGDNIESPDDFE